MQEVASTHQIYICQQSNANKRAHAPYVFVSVVPSGFGTEMGQRVCSFEALQTGGKLGRTLSNYSNVFISVSVSVNLQDALACTSIVKEHIPRRGHQSTMLSKTWDVEKTTITKFL